jgi:hypothetical protein
MRPAPVSQPQLVAGDPLRSYVLAWARVSRVMQPVDEGGHRPNCKGEQSRDTALVTDRYKAPHVPAPRSSYAYRDGSVPYPAVAAVSPARKADAPPCEGCRT